MRNVCNINGRLVGRNLSLEQASGECGPSILQGVTHYRDIGTVRCGVVTMAETITGSWRVVRLSSLEDFIDDMR